MFFSFAVPFLSESDDRVQSQNVCWNQHMVPVRRDDVKELHFVSCT